MDWDGKMARQQGNQIEPNTMNRVQKRICTHSFHKIDAMGSALDVDNMYGIACC